MKKKIEKFVEVKRRDSFNKKLKPVQYIRNICFEKKESKKKNKSHDKIIKVVKKIIPMIEKKLRRKKKIIGRDLNISRKFNKLGMDKKFYNLFRLSRVSLFINGKNSDYWIRTFNDTTGTVPYSEFEKLKIKNKIWKRLGFSRIHLGLNWEYFNEEAIDSRLHYTTLDKLREYEVKKYLNKRNLKKPPDIKKEIINKKVNSPTDFKLLEECKIGEDQDPSRKITFRVQVKNEKGTYYKDYKELNPIERAQVISMQCLAGSHEFGNIISNED